ncbi:hypothetical protein MCC02038_19650 [Bifidobacteriaceae bacterium MCC02038]|nr:hypothetical protein MCC02038_19650 [Bifidobacteriaceae bacterium MCC02038]
MVNRRLQKKSLVGLCTAGNGVVSGEGEPYGVGVGKGEQGSIVGRGDVGWG